ncbi:MAG: YciI family protein [Tsuneonella sp.]
MTRLYAIVARDHPNMMPTRMKHLKEHLAYTEAGMDRLAVAGPLRDNEGQISGSMLVVRAESIPDARALLEMDPYFKAGIWADIQISEFNAAAGSWVGGKTW